MKIAFKQYSEKDKQDVLEMMISFNENDGYDFDPIIGEKNLLDFTSNESLGRCYLINHEQKTIGYIILTFGLIIPQYLGQLESNIKF